MVFSSFLFISPYFYFETAPCAKEYSGFTEVLLVDSTRLRFLAGSDHSPFSV